MKTSKFTEIILNQDDLCDLLLQGHDITRLRDVTVDTDVDLPALIAQQQDAAGMMTWRLPEDSDLSIQEFDRARQDRWFMPDAYRDMDIAEHVLSLCHTPAQLQRVGQELLLYQQHELFDLLRYMKYLVDVMTENKIIWGVGRGSSVASYVLYLLGVHRIDSMFYDLDPREFLR